jgi:CHAD domain-containing protein/glycosidase
VLLDVVYNHLGPSGNYLSRFGPYFTDAHHTPWGEAVNLDGPHSAPVRRFIIDNALRWLRDFHMDGLRLDAVHELKDDSPRHLLAQLSDETASLATDLGRPLTLIAESDLNDDIVVRPTAHGGRGMQAQWADDVHHAIHACLTGERHGYYCDFGDLPTLAKALTRVFVHDGGWSTFRGRHWGRPVDRQAVGGHSFVVSTSTHDQVGNRAHGDRPGHRLSPARKAVAAALLLTAPFTPMLFMGEEFDASTPWQFFSDHLEPELAQAILQGRREEFAAHGWPADEISDPGDPATRQRSVLNWNDLDDPARRAMSAWYRDLIRLRRTHRELLDDQLSDVTVEVDTRGETLVMSRRSLAVVVSLAAAPRRVRLTRRPGHLLMAWPGAVLSKRSVMMPAEGVAIVRTDQTVTVRDAVSGYLRRIGAELQAAVDADDVHDMRVACRRIRSVLRAHQACWRGRDRARSVSIADDARSVARTLSDHRDSEVLGEVIDAWAAADGWSTQTRDELLALLYPQGPSDGDDGLAREQARADARRVATDLAAFLDDASWRGRSSRPAVGALIGYRSRAAARVATRVHDAGDTTPQDDPQGGWHLVRKAAKRLRYTGELGADVDDPGAAEVASAAKHVQTVIGDLQDARLMLDRLTALTGDSPAAAVARDRARRVIQQTSSDLTPALNRLWHSESGLLDGHP